MIRRILVRFMTCDVALVKLHVISECRVTFTVAPNDAANECPSPLGFLTWRHGTQRFTQCILFASAACQWLPTTGTSRLALNIGNISGTALLGDPRTLAMRRDRALCLARGVDAPSLLALGPHKSSPKGGPSCGRTFGWTRRLGYQSAAICPTAAPSPGRPDCVVSEACRFAADRTGSFQLQCTCH